MYVATDSKAVKLQTYNSYQPLDEIKQSVRLVNHYQNLNLVRKTKKNVARKAMSAFQRPTIFGRADVRGLR